MFLDSCFQVQKSLLFGFLAVVTGCGSAHRNALLKSEDSILRPMIVVSGGFGSCTRAGGRIDPRPTSVAVEARKIIADLKTAGFEDVDTAISCFSAALVNPSELIYYVLSNEPSTIYSGSRQEFYNSVTRLAESVPNRITFVAGHSYGGWNAAQVALKLKRSTRIATLTTIDPISPVNCRPGNFLAGGIDSDGDGEGGCREAPTDLSNQDQNQIQDNVGSWSNFFQKDYFRLHSSEIQAASVNQQIRFGTNVRNAHTAIDNDPTVWKSVREGIMASLVSDSPTPLVSPTPQASPSPLVTPSTPPPQTAPDGDLFVLLGENTSNTSSVELTVSAGSGVVSIEVCSGLRTACLADPRVVLSFVGQGFIGGSGTSGGSGAGRAVFRGANALAVAERAPFTILGRNSKGNIISARTVTFVTK